MLFYLFLSDFYLEVQYCTGNSATTLAHKRIQPCRQSSASSSGMVQSARYTHCRAAVHVGFLCCEFTLWMDNLDGWAMTCILDSAPSDAH